jgi:large repetitive protein
MGGAGADIGSSIAVNGSGNIYTTGYFQGTVDFDPGSGTFNLTAAGGIIDAFVHKMGPASTGPTVTINQAAAQPDPTAASPINFTVVFSEPVTGFATGDVTLAGTAGATTATVTGSGTTYNVAVSGMTANGTVIANIPAAIAVNGCGTGNLASTSTDNTVTYTGIVDPPPTVTINQAAAQPDPTAASPINFTVVFNETVTGFATGDVTLSGTAGATTATVTGSGTTYNVAVSGMTANGTVIANIPAGVAIDAGSNPNAASTSTDNTVTYTGIVDPPPTVTINQAAAQADPTGTSPINFAVIFNETVTGFATGDVTLSGTAGATTAIVTGSGTTYNVAVSGMTANGTVIATVPAGVAIDAGSNQNTASTSTDNTVQFNLVTCILTCPANITVSNATGQCGAFVNYPAPTISGSCGTVTASHASGSFFPVGTTTVTVTSSAGPVCTFTVTVNGGTDKVNIFPVPSNGNLSIAVCNELAGATVRAFNMNGQKVREWIINAGLNSYQFNWQAGVYFLEFIKGSLREEKKILIVR